MRDVKCPGAALVAGVVVPGVLITLAAAGLGAQAPAQADRVRTALMDADRAFNQAMAERNLGRFLSFVAEDASFESAAGRGRDAVAKAWQAFFAPDGPAISWAPTRADVLVGGDVGYTVGSWERRSRGADGRPVATHGEYLTVWRKQMDGSWQAVFDTGSTRRPPIGTDVVPPRSPK